jgi:hypothetical protein
MKCRGPLGNISKTYSNKIDNLEGKENFLDTYGLPKLSQEDINHLNRSIMSKVVEAVTKIFPINKSPAL